MGSLFSCALKETYLNPFDLPAESEYEVIWISPAEK
jgi:hypothetical protein